MVDRRNKRHTGYPRKTAKRPLKVMVDRFASIGTSRNMLETSRRHRSIYKRKGGGKKEERKDKDDGWQMKMRKGQK